MDQAESKWKKRREFDEGVDLVFVVGSFANYSKSLSREDVKLSRLQTVHARCKRYRASFDHINVTEMLINGVLNVETRLEK